MMIPLFMFQTPLFRRKGPKPHSLQSLRPRGALQQIVLLYGIFFCFSTAPGKKCPKTAAGPDGIPQGAPPGPWAAGPYCWPVGCWLEYLV